MKKVILTTAAIALLSAGITAQNQSRTKPTKAAAIPTANASQTNNPPAYVGTMYNRCGTHTPTKEWDEWFNEKVEQRKQDLANGRAMATSYTVAVVFHVIYTSGQAEGTGYNISQAQINSQIPILNADYGGTGVGVSTYTALTSGGHGPFYDYATGNTLPAPDNTTSGVKVANTGIHFCLAKVNPSGVTLAEPGIDRHTWESISGATDPSLVNSEANFTALFDNTIKPATIWDPTRYFNVWTSAGGTTAVGLLGYSTFPSGTTLTGLSGGGSGSASSTTDGCWVNCTAVGNTGSVSAPYNLGRTLTHESGHYFGLRHTWGDGSGCPAATDYCNDTPPESAATFYGSGTGNTSWVYPYTATDNCSNTGAYNSDLGDGIMYMAFMDYSDDQYMCMFTNDQLTRMTTALTQCPDRSGLTTAAVSLCNLTETTPVANFTFPSPLCMGVAEQFTDASSGPPSSWAWSISPSTGVTISSSTAENPTITFPSAGTYSVTLAATNTVGTNSNTQVVTVTSCNLSSCDTLSNFVSSDTLTIYKLGHDSGYVSGNNIYGDLAKAEYYSSASLTNTQITSVICLFYKNGTEGTKGTGTVSLDIMNGTSTGGPTGTAVATATANLATIAATTPVTHVDYCGNPSLAFSTAIMIPYKFTFASPVTTPSTGFFASLNLPTTTGDTLVLMQNAIGNASHTTNSAWELDAPTPGTWANVETDWGFTSAVSFAILPIVCPISTTGIQHNELGSNINLFPNPNNGQFSFVVTLAQATNLNFTVINTLGQVVYAKTENNITSGVLNCDLSHLVKGIYYANITDSNNNKTVKKIIIE